MQAILSELALAAEFVLDNLFVDNTRQEALEKSGPHDALRRVLSRWAAADPKPLVLLIDEVDALAGDTLVSMLRQLRKTVIECKLLHGSLARTVRDGLEQTRAYMDHCAAEAGHLVIFDRTTGRSWNEKIFQRTETADGPAVTVWGM